MQKKGQRRLLHDGEVL